MISFCVCNMIYITIHGVKPQWDHCLALAAAQKNMNVSRRGILNITYILGFATSTHTLSP